MSIKSIRTGYKGVSALAGNPVLGDFESIATTTLSANTASVTFSSIPDTFQNLQIRGTARTSEASTASNLRIRVNSDTGNNYTYHYLVGDGGSAYSGAGGANQNSGLLGITAGGNATTGIFGSFVVDILDYKSVNKTKTIRSIAGLDLNGTGGRIEFVSSLWNNSNTAISSITIDNFAGGTLATSSHFALYGIRG